MKNGKDMKEKAGRRRKNGGESGKRGKKKYRSIKVKTRPEFETKNTRHYTCKHTGGLSCAYFLPGYVCTCRKGASQAVQASSVKRTNAS